MSGRHHWAQTIAASRLPSYDRFSIDARRPKRKRPVPMFIRQLRKGWAGLATNTTYCATVEEPGLVDELSIAGALTVDPRDAMGPAGALPALAVSTNRGSSWTQTAHAGLVREWQQQLGYRVPPDRRPWKPTNDNSGSPRLCRLRLLHVARNARQQRLPPRRWSSASVETVRQIVVSSRVAWCHLVPCFR
jgi:hypothetical protein